MKLLDESDALALNLRQNPLVLIMSTDPNPIVDALIQNREGSVSISNTYRPKGSHFLEMEGGVPRVLVPKSVHPPRTFANR